MKPLVLDLGMHNGDDTHYYLLKGYRVVAVEANPHRVSDARIRFAPHIQSGDLIIIHAAIGVIDGETTFHINNKADVLSSIFKEGKGDPADWEPITVRCISILSLLREFGTPLYLKIDIEGMDQTVLKQLMSAKIAIPMFISCEIVRSDSLCYLSVMGYNRFYIQNCATVPNRYNNINISVHDGCTLTYNFPVHSTGPFGEDVGEPYYDLDKAMLIISTREIMLGKGWFDIHACVWRSK